MSTSRPLRCPPVRSAADHIGDSSSAVADLGQTTGRRRVLRGAFAAALGMVSAPFLVASGSAGRSAGAQETWFDETHRGRRIVGVRHDDSRSGGGVSGTWHVAVDGRPLHLMRRADGSWVSMVDHYRSYATPLAAARAAVDELGPTARLGAPGDKSGRMEDSRTPSGSGRASSGGQGAEGDHRSGVHA